MFKSGLIFLLLLVTTSTFADSFLIDDFNKRFKVHRDESGKATMILDREVYGDFKVRPYIEFIKSAIMHQQANFDESYINGLVEEEMKNGDKNHAPIIMDSMNEIRKLNVRDIFSNPKFNEVISKYEKELSDALSVLSFGVLANMEKPTFFYYRRLTYEVTLMGIKLAKRWLSNVPVLNTAMYVIVEVEKLIRERRLYHQNMLLHYLDKLTPEQLGLTHSEVSRAWSSIFESRIPWYAFWESNNAKANWEKFGPNNFYANFRMASNRLRNYRNNYVEIQTRINYGFQVVTSKEKGKMILNLLDSRDEFSTAPSVAYYYDDPNKVMKDRLIFMVARLGLSFVPIPQFIKDLGDSFLKSKYTRQPYLKALYLLILNLWGKKKWQEIF